MTPPVCPACGAAHDSTPLHYDGGYYLCDGERRTLLRTTPAASQRAWERGERYTRGEYLELSVVVHGSATKAGARRRR